METLQLNSSDSSEVYPNNTPSEFTLNIHPHLQLKGKWKVGIREISYSTKILMNARIEFLDDTGDVWGYRLLQSTLDGGLLSILTLMTKLPRRESTQVTTYDLSELVKLCTDHMSLRPWSNHHTRIADSIEDVPIISVNKMYIKKQAVTRVNLYTEDRRLYEQRFYDHPTLTREQYKDPMKSNSVIYNAAKALPRKPLPTDYVKKGEHTSFDFSDVGQLTYDNTTKEYTLTCVNNEEGVGGIAITLGNGTARCMKNTRIKFREEFNDVLVVHSDMVKPQEYGGASTDLLTIIPRVAKDWRDNYSHILYKKIRYVPLHQSFLNKVKIQFKTIRGTPIQFPPEAEHTSLTLELVKDDTR